MTAGRGASRTTLRPGARHEGFLRHRRVRWLIVAALLSALAIWGYERIAVQPRHNGGSWYGYTLGTVGALLILWLTMLGVRKRAMTRGRWSLKGWTSAHVWLGLALLVIATLHTGFQFGWNIHTLAYALMIGVIVSGVYGVAVYSLLPAELSNSRAGMTRPQMVAALLTLDRQLEAAAQPLGGAEAEAVRRAVGDDPLRAGLFSRLTGFHPGCRTARALRNVRRAGAGRDEDEPLAKVAALLERKRAVLAQIRRHLRIKALLEVWLYAHVPLTFGLIAALAAHIVSVFFYR